MTLNEKKEQICNAVDQIMPQEKEVGQFIFDHAELGNQEFESSGYLAEELKKLGFDVTYPYAGVATALRADLRNGDGPTIAVLAEYDALPGYGPNKDQNAHACGHNWIAATCYGVCAAFARLKDSFRGTISLIGAPAEETVGGKIDVIRGGGYDDVDAVLQCHLGAEKTNLDCVFLAMDSIEFTFHGKAAHAAGHPEAGVNALDAVMLTYAGINCLRQHITPDARIHGIVTEGGKAPNIVPDLGQCRFYIRAEQREYLDTLREKVINVARGAALMTGCEMEWRYFENPFDNLVCNDKLKALMKQNLETLGDTDFAHLEGHGSGSSDVGNVSRLCPTCYAEIATGMDNTVTAHMEKFLEVIVGPYADRSMALASKAMAMTALDIFENPEVLK